MESPNEHQPRTKSHTDFSHRFRRTHARLGLTLSLLTVALCTVLIVGAVGARSTPETSDQAASARFDKSEIIAALSEADASVSRLRAQLAETSGESGRLALVRRIEAVKQQTEIDLLDRQALIARKHGLREAAVSIESASAQALVTLENQAGR